MKWYRQAAEQNLAKAQFNLGICYSKGCGVVKDEVEASKWFRKAADQNDAEGQSYLGAYYFSGIGVGKDEVEGYKWLLLAAAQGYERAKKLLTELEFLMTRKHIIEGKRLASEFKPRKSGKCFIVSRDGESK